MSIFTNPSTFSDDVRLSGAEMNTHLGDNMLALKFPPTAIYNSSGLLTDWSTASTSFTAVDATHLALTITTTGDGQGNPSDVLIWLTGTVYTSGAARVYFRVLEDGATINIDGDGLCVSEGTGVRPICFMFLRANASIGTHTYTLGWKTNTGTAVLLANVGTSGRDCKTQFGVREAT